MNTFSLKKVQVTKVTSLLVLAIFAIAFFAFPFGTYAMKGGCGKKSSTLTPTLSNGLNLVDKAIVKTNLTFTLNGVYTDANGNPSTGWGSNPSGPVSFIALSTGQVTNLTQGEWVNVTPTGGKPIKATILDGQGLTVTVSAPSAPPVWGMLQTNLPIKVAAIGSSGSW